MQEWLFSTGKTLFSTRKTLYSTRKTLYSTRNKTLKTGGFETYRKQFVLSSLVGRQECRPSYLQYEDTWSLRFAIVRDETDKRNRRAHRNRCPGGKILFSGIGGGISSSWGWGLWLLTPSASRCRRTSKFRRRSLFRCD